MWIPVLYFEKYFLSHNAVVLLLYLFCALMTMNDIAHTLLLTIDLPVSTSELYDIFD